MTQQIYALTARIIGACDNAIRAIEDLRKVELHDRAERSWACNQPGWLRRLFGAKGSTLQDFVTAFVAEASYPFGKPYGAKMWRLQSLRTMAITSQREDPGATLTALTREDCWDLRKHWSSEPGYEVAAAD